MMDCAGILLNWVAIFSGVASACAWWKSSNVRVGGGIDGGVIGEKSPDEKFVNTFINASFFEKYFSKFDVPQTQFSTLFLSSYYNKDAALCATVAATATAIARLI